jgi:hypothetical protein
MRPDGQGTRGCSGATKACKSECAERRVCLWWPGGFRLLYLSRTFHRWSRDRAVRTVVDQALDLHVPAVPGGGEVREPLLESRRAAIGVPGVRDVVVEDFDVGVEAPPARLARLGEALETAPDALDVLLRHRPPSIPQATARRRVGAHRFASRFGVTKSVSSALPAASSLQLPANSSVASAPLGYLRRTAANCAPPPLRLSASSSSPGLWPITRTDSTSPSRARRRSSSRCAEAA